MCSLSSEPAHSFVTEDGWIQAKSGSSLDGKMCSQQDGFVSCQASRFTATQWREVWRLYQWTEETVESCDARHHCTSRFVSLVPL